MSSDSTRSMPIRSTAGQTYVIDMARLQSYALDPYLILTDGSGKKLAEDDDGGGASNARIVVRAEPTGTYRILATAWDAGAGTFTLTVREGANPEKDKSK